MNKIESSEYDVVIVGGGPGGTLAAHYGFMRGKGAARWLEGDGNEFQERVTKNYINESEILKIVVGEWYSNNRAVSNWRWKAQEITKHLDVYEKEDGTIRLMFKDEMTGKDGVFDPGENQVGLTVEGSGRSGLKVSQYFFELLNQAGIQTHFLAADLEEKSMDVKKAVVFGQGLEVICRYKAVGSFIRRYADYIESGADLNGYVEITIKDDERQDPFISKDALVLLGILSEAEYDLIKEQTKRICDLIKEELATKGLTLYDIKLEFGRGEKPGEIMLIDELSGGNMRVFNGEESVYPLDLETYLF